jgi:hypothetical protein
VEGGICVADFNGDGWLDVFITGDEINGGEAGFSEMTVLLNDQNGSFTVSSQPNFPVNFRQWMTSVNTARAYDWNGDGNTDLIVTGHQPIDNGGVGTQLAYYFLNDGTGIFQPGVRIPGATEACILLPDWNGDGVRDYLVQGQSWDASVYPADWRIAAVMINAFTTINERPTAPTDLNSVVNGRNITLNWQAGTDNNTPEASLSYEYYIKDSNENFYVACRSHVGGTLDGTRKILDLGNAMLNKSITIRNLPDGNYTWGVQSIDACYDGSVFATGAFTIGANSINTLNTENINIHSAKGILYISLQQPAEVFVYTVNGVLIQSFANKSNVEISLQKGVYIVKTDIGNIPHKVIVK